MTIERSVLTLVIGPHPAQRGFQMLTVGRVGRRTLRAEELARDVEGLATNDHDLLAREELLGHDAGKAAKEMTLAIDDDLQRSPLANAPISSIPHAGNASRRRDDGQLLFPQSASPVSGTLPAALAAHPRSSAIAKCPAVGGEGYSQPARTSTSYRSLPSETRERGVKGRKGDTTTNKSSNRSGENLLLCCCGLVVPWAEVVGWWK